VNGLAVPSYEHCEAVTRANARNFYYGIRLLPTPRRSAMCAIYSFARRVDDIADGPGTTAAKLAGLRAASDDLHRLGGPTDDPVMLALADAAERFPIPLDAFDDLIAGARMDVVGARYEHYGDADGRADDLGVAMQLTNILRDVGEDLAAGRVYLPDEDMAAFGCDISGETDPDALADLIRFEAARAHGWFAVGRRLLPLLDRPSAACVATIAGTYEQLLRRIERRPQAVVRERVRVPVWTKAWIVSRALVESRT